jgi:hypothetical protein
MGSGFYRSTSTLTLVLDFVVDQPKFQSLNIQTLQLEINL